MYIRINRAKGRRYMNVCHNHWRDGMSETQMLWSLGRYDEARLKQARKALKSWRKLDHHEKVLEEINSDCGPLQGKGFLKRFRSQF